MAQEHGDIFAEDPAPQKPDTINLDRFKPKPQGADDRPGQEELRGIAERTKFIGREGQGLQPPKIPLRRRGNHRTGRTAIVTLKTTPEHSNRFYAIADARGWLVGETFERALEALEREMRHGAGES